MIECSNCHSQLIVTRTRTEVAVKTQKTHTSPEILTDEIVEQVKNSLPPQPWPTGTSKEIADKLGLPPRIVSDAITKLVQMGVFELQYYGKLYVPKSKKAKTQTKNSQDGKKPKPNSHIIE